MPPIGVKSAHYDIFIYVTVSLIPKHIHAIHANKTSVRYSRELVFKKGEKKRKFVEIVSIVLGAIFCPNVSSLDSSHLPI